MKNVGRIPALMAAAVMLMACAGDALADGWYTTAFVIWDKESGARKPLTPMDQISASVPQGPGWVVARHQEPPAQSAAIPAAIN